VNEATRKFPVPPVSEPWHFEVLVRQILGFVQDHLLPVAPEAEGPRLLEIEKAATNGMLYALDPHSVLLDAETYRGMFSVGQSHRPSAGVGVELKTRDKDEVEIVRLAASGPAALAGLRPGDRLMRVDDLDVRHMNLADVVAHLVGDAGSAVRLTVSHRKREETIAVIRDFVKGIGSVAECRVLTTRGRNDEECAIGYIRLEHFGRDAERGIVDALAEFAKAGVAGVVLDLRDNSGGLYDQGIKVADAFIKKGRIVAMVAPGGRRKDEEATDSGSEPTVPVAVLVNHGSAAAAELVAAALRENDRAVVVGEKTFGEGSVQVLFNIRSPLSRAASENLGLKLTTAEWVTPSNKSIQRTGLTPDIVLIPEGVSDAQEDSPLRVEAPVVRSEAAYDAALDGMGAAVENQSLISVPFVFVAARSPGSPEITIPFADGAGRDFAAHFARDLLASSSSASRMRVLEGAKKFLDDVRGAEDRHLVSALRRRSVDWAAGRGSMAAGQLELDLTTSGGEKGPGQTVVVHGVARNMGKEALHHVQTVLKAPGDYFDTNELTFGAIPPGRARSADVAVKIPAGAPLAAHAVTVQATCDECGERTVREFVIQTAGVPQPVFAIDYATAEAPPPPAATTAPPPGLRRKQLVVRVQNIGAGAAKNLLATLENAPGQEDVRMDVGLFRTERLEAGQVATFSFIYDDLLDDRDEPYRFDLLLSEDGSAVVARHRISFQRGGSGAAAGHVSPPVVSASAATVVHAASVRVTGEATSSGGLRDVFVTVQLLGRYRPQRKVFYLASPGGGPRLPFAADIPLEVGSNYLRVVARGVDGAATTYPLSVLMTAPSGVVKVSP